MAADETHGSINEYESINEFVVVGEFGFQRVPGPFEVAKGGTVWGIVVPEGAHPTVQTLPGQEGEAAVTSALDRAADALADAQEVLGDAE